MQNQYILTVSFLCRRTLLHKGKIKTEKNVKVQGDPWLVDIIAGDDFVDISDKKKGNIDMSPVN